MSDSTTHLDSIRVDDTDTKTNQWSVYILCSSDGQLYTGITNNMVARWKKHQGNHGAKFFRGKHPIALCYQEPEHSRSSASQREYQIKQLSRANKLRLINEYYGPFLSNSSQKAK